MAAFAIASEVPVLALIDAGGRIKHSTEPFRGHYAGTRVPSEHWATCERVLSGDRHRAAIEIDGSEAKIEAVLDHRGTRHLLMSMSGDEQGGSALEQGVAASPVIAYLKDLDGRYLCINNRYTELLGASDERMLGKMDTELQPRETVDGPRLQHGSDPTAEPLQLEYIVPAIEDRPALAVLRFAVRDRDGQPIGVCGVAAPATDAHLARAECGRLMQLERWSRLDRMTIEQELWEEWGIERATPNEPEQREGPSAIDPALATAIADRDSALSASVALEQEMDRARRQIATLQEASTSASQRAQELLTEVAAAQGRSEQLEEQLATMAAAHSADQADLRRQLAEAVTGAERARGDAEETHAQIAQARAEAHEARAAADEARSDVDEARSEMADARTAADEARAAADEARSELENTLSQMHVLQAELQQLRAVSEDTAEVDALRQALVEAQAESQHGRAESDQLRAAVDQANEFVAHAQSEADQARAETDQVRNQLEDMLTQMNGLEAELQHTRSVSEDTAEVDALRQALEEARLMADQARTEADQARAEAGQSRTEADQSRTEAHQTHADSAQARAEAGQVRAQLEETLSRMNELEAELAQLRAASEDTRQAGALQEALHNAQAESQHARTEANQARGQLEGTLAHVAALEAHANELRTALDEAEATVSRLERERDEARAPVQPDPTPDREGTPLRWSAVAQHAFAVALAGASEWRVGLKDVIKVLGAEGGWDAVTAWTPDDGAVLRCAAMWAADHELAAFETVTWQRPYRAAGCSLGEALYSPHPVWLTKMTEGGDERLAAAAAHGMHCALLVPIRDGIATIGMLEFLTRAEAVPDLELSKALEAVALQLGHFSHLLHLGAKPHWGLGRL